MTPIKHLHGATLTPVALRSPNITDGTDMHAGVEYVYSDLHVRQVRGLAVEECLGDPFSELRELNLPAWDGTPLHGKRVAFISSGGIGDSLLHTAVVSHIKRLYPSCSIAVVCQRMMNESVWQFNYNIERGQPYRYPFPAAALRAFDFVIDPQGLIYHAVESRNWYDEVFAWLGVTPEREEWKRPSVYIHEAEPMQAFSHLFPYFDFGRGGEPSGYAVVQLNSSKQSRNVPPSLWMEVIRGLMQRIPDNPVVLLGEGDYAREFAGRLSEEVFNVKLVQGNIAFPPIVTCLQQFAAPPIPAVFYRVRAMGDLGAGQMAQLPNANLSLRGIMPIVRNAAVCITPDSMLAHLCGARGIGVPCVSLFGPFSPAWRVTTYPRQVAIWKREVCEHAPCAHHDDGLPVGCPSQSGWCSVLDSVTAGDVLAAVDGLLTNNQ